MAGTFGQADATFGRPGASFGSVVIDRPVSTFGQAGVTFGHPGATFGHAVLIPPPTWVAFEAEGVVAVQGIEGASALSVSFEVSGRLASGIVEAG